MNEGSVASILALVVVISSTVAGVVAFSATDKPVQPVINHNPTSVINSSVYQSAYDNYMDAVVAIKAQNVFDSSQGSGFLYNDQGYIVTNHHVIDGAAAIAVRFRNDEWRKADVIGSDPYTDLAVLKVSDVPTIADPLPLSASNPAPGTVVMALGNPFGLEETITQGIVSGVNRSVSTVGGYSIPDTVQTDAAINPGNSGGPLITADGTVVGVNRAKQGDNIGFAISPSIVQNVVPSLVEDGDYDNPFFGASFRQVTPFTAEANNLAATRGIIVVEIMPNGPSARHLQPSRFVARRGMTDVPVGGDVITAINGNKVNTPQQLSSYIARNKEAGETVTLTFIRDGEQRTIEITLGSRPRLATGYQ